MGARWTTSITRLSRRAQRDDLRDLEQQLALRDGDVESFHNNGNNENHSNVKSRSACPSREGGAHSVNGGVSVRDVGAEVRAPP